MNDYYINLSYEDRRNTSFIETKTKKTSIFVRLFTIAKHNPDAKKLQFYESNSTRQT